MKRWMIGGIIGAAVGVAIYLLVTRKADPVQSSAVAPPAPVVAAAPPLVPVVLPEVVDLIDLDPLLDPPVKALVGAPFENEPLSAGTTPATKRIPPAVD